MIIEVFDSGSGLETETSDFTYVMLDNESGIITIKYYDSYCGEDTDTFPFRIIKGQLYLYEDIEYTELIVILSRE